LIVFIVYVVTLTLERNAMGKYLDIIRKVQHDPTSDPHERAKTQDRDLIDHIKEHAPGHREFLVRTGRDCACLRARPISQPGDGCIVCGDSWGLITHGLRFCGIDCYERYRQGIPNGPQADLPANTFLG
jgi:hypothetical protein